MTTKRFTPKHGIDANNKTIINVGNPVNDTDVATKGFSKNASNITTGTLSIDRLPPSVVNNVTISGPTSGTNLSSLVYTITNYDVTTTYTIKVVDNNGVERENGTGYGSIARSGDTITYVPPATQNSGTYGFTINGKLIPVTITSYLVSKPSILAPTNNATNVSRNYTVISSTFSITPPNAATHYSTDWQLATDADFTNIAVQSLNDTVNLTSWNVTNLNPLTTYYLRVRYKSSDINV